MCYTYIYNWPLQPFSQDYSLASHTRVVCVNFIHEWLDPHFNDDSERQMFKELRIVARNLLKVSEDTIFFHIEKLFFPNLGYVLGLPNTLPTRLR